MKNTILKSNFSKCTFIFNLPKKNFKIFIELDQPQRDLDGLLFFVNLIKGTYPFSTIFLVPRDRIFLLGLFEMPDLVIFAKSQSPYIPFFYLIGSKIVIHENEGIPYKKNDLVSDMSLINKMCVSSYWLWGEEQYYTMKSWKSIHFPPKKISIAGGLRYEYYKYLPKSTHTGGIQFNTNFPTLSPKYNDIFSEVKTLIKWFPSIANSFIDDIPISAGRRERLLFFISKLKEEKIINIRPHPFESVSYYEKNLPLYYSVKLSKINFITDTDIHDDLFYISMCFNSGCQTTLDSLIRGAIPVSFEDSGNIWDKFSYSYKEAKELSKLPVHLIQKRISQFAISKGVNNYLFNFSNDVNIKKLISPFIKNTNNCFFKKIFRPFLKIAGMFLLEFIYPNKKSRTTVQTFMKRVDKVSPFFRHKKYLENIYVSNNKNLPYLKQ